MLAHGIRGRWWCYASRGWTFPPISHCILLPCNIMAAEGQSDTMASDMEVCMAQRCGTEFFLAEKMPLIDIHQYLPNASGDQTVDVSTVRQWVVCFSSDNNSGSPPLVPILMSNASSCLLTKMDSWWWWLCWRIAFCSWEFALSNSVIVLFVSVVVSMEIKRRHYFRSSLHIF